MTVQFQKCSVVLKNAVHFQKCSPTLSNLEFKCASCWHCDDKIFFCTVALLDLCKPQHQADVMLLWQDTFASNTHVSQYPNQPPQMPLQKCSHCSPSGQLRIGTTPCPSTPEKIFLHQHLRKGTSALLLRGFPCWLLASSRWLCLFKLALWHPCVDSSLY